MSVAILTVFFRLLRGRALARRLAVETTWEPLLLAVLSGELSPEGLTQRIDPRDTRYFVEYLSGFVRRLSGPEQERLLDLAEPFLPRLRRTLRVRSPERRAGAVETISLLAPSTGSEELLAALDDSSPFVALVAARALTRAGGVDHIAPLIARLHRFQRWRPSYLAAMLTALGPPAIPALLAAFRYPATPIRVRVAAAEALGRLNAAVAGDSAAQEAAGSQDPDLRAAALNLLRRVGHGIHLQLIRRAMSDEAESVRLAATRALVALGDRRESPLLLKAMEQDPSRWVTEQAARGVLALEGPAPLLPHAEGTGPIAQIVREVLEDHGR